MNATDPLAAPIADGTSVSLDCEPVRVDPEKANRNLFSLLLEARSNLLSIWPASAYRDHTFSFRFLRQHYFVCNTPDAIRRVFLDEHDNYDRKSPQMRHALEPLLGDGLFVSDGALWRQRREHCAPAFASELLPGFADIMADSARALADRWASLGQGGRVDMLNEMARLTAHIIGRTIFGDELDDREAAQVVKGFSAYQQRVEQMSLADSLGLPFLRWFGNPVRRARAARSAAEVHDIIDRIIARHDAHRSPERQTLLSLLLDDQVSDGDQAGRCPIGATGARNEAIVMFMAGHETTANALAWTWYLLDHCPRATGRLHEELDRVLGDRPPAYNDIPELPYTRAVFEEAMRLYPPVPLLSRQARASDRIQNQAIRADTIILVIPWLLHRHEAFWEKPNHFIPERFLPPAQRPDKFLYLPFSVGRRVCLGTRFGLTEGILCLATLAQRFRPRLTPGHRPAIECRLTLRPSGGLPMTLEPRRP